MHATGNGSQPGPIPMAELNAASLLADGVHDPAAPGFDLAGFDIDYAQLVLAEILRMPVAFVVHQTYLALVVGLRTGECDVGIAAMELCVRARGKVAHALPRRALRADAAVLRGPQRQGPHDVRLDVRARAARLCAGRQRGLRAQRARGVCVAGLLPGVRRAVLCVQLRAGQPPAAPRAAAGEGAAVAAPDQHGAHHPHHDAHSSLAAVRRRACVGRRQILPRAVHERLLEARLPARAGSAVRHARTH